MTTRRTKLASIAMAGMLALAACGGGDSESSSTTPAAAGSTSASAPASTSAASSSSAGSSSGSGSYDAAGCAAVGQSLMDIANVALDSLSGDFSQADFDKAFPGGVVDKFPKDLQAGYTELETLAKDLIGKSQTEAMEASQAFSTKISDYTNQVSKACIPS
ncbi:MAG: hypothetical protein LCH82_11050 [Actinobacteria bacterium]|nr:hypothetical protein [Actinomycetota bacterium]